MPEKCTRCVRKLLARAPLIVGYTHICPSDVRTNIHTFDEIWDLFRGEIAAIYEPQKEPLK